MVKPCLCFGRANCLSFCWYHTASVWYRDARFVHRVHDVPCGLSHAVDFEEFRMHRSGHREQRPEKRDEAPNKSAESIQQFLQSSKLGHWPVAHASMQVLRSDADRHSRGWTVGTSVPHAETKRSTKSQRERNGRLEPRWLRTDATNQRTTVRRTFLVDRTPSFIYLCLSLSASVCLCLPLAVSICICLSLSASIIYLFLSACLSVCLSLCLCVCLSACGLWTACGSKSCTVSR